MFLAYALPKGRALVDRELCLPRSWTGDEARLAGAQLPEGRQFKAKPQLLRLMIERAVAAGVPFRWVTADEAYRDNGPLRGWLEEQRIPYVLAVARGHMVATPTGPRRADVLAPAGAWHRQPVLPMMPRHAEKRTHDYARHGTVDLFAAFDIATGLVIAKTYKSHRSSNTKSRTRQKFMSSQTTTRLTRRLPSRNG